MNSMSETEFIRWLASLIEKYESAPNESGYYALPSWVVLEIAEKLKSIEQKEAPLDNHLLD